jgi:hypothetical protein
MKEIGTALALVFLTWILPCLQAMAQETRQDQTGEPSFSRDAGAQGTGPRNRSTSRAFQIPDTVFLEVVSEPAGARIYLDGVLLKRVTPARIELQADPGSHRIHLEKKGYRPWEETTSFMHGEHRTVKANLNRNGGTMQLHTEPWTIVFINGEVAGATPLFTEEIEEGTHKVRMINEEFGIDATENVLLKTGERKKLFKRFNGILEIHLPPGMDTYLNGELLQEDAPVVTRNLSCGYYQVKRVSRINGTETLANVLLKDMERKEIF